MKRKEIKNKYTRVVKMTRGFNCYLQIDNQSFCIAEQRTKLEANWYAKMLSIALENFLKSNIVRIDAKA